jgi:hypothetical protein
MHSLLRKGQRMGKRLLPKKEELRDSVGFLQEWYDLSKEEIRLTELENAGLRRALEALIKSPVVSGMSAGIRDEARKRGKPDPFSEAKKALKAQQIVEGEKK